MQIYQGNFVADIEPIRNKRTPTTHFRIRVTQLRPVELLISDSIATDAKAARESRCEASRGSGLREGAEQGCVTFRRTFPELADTAMTWKHSSGATFNSLLAVNAA